MTERTNGNRQVCHLWRPLLKRYATFDEEPTIEPRQTN